MGWGLRQGHGRTWISDAGHSTLADPQSWVTRFQDGPDGLPRSSIINDSCFRKAMMVPAVWVEFRLLSRRPATTNHSR